MPAAFCRPMVRGSQFLRQWQLLLRLRRGPCVLPTLARHVGASERTVRRDLALLTAAGLPISASHDAVKGKFWCVRSMPEWPRNEVLPVRSLLAAEHYERTR